MLSIRTSSSKGFDKNSTAPALSAWNRISSSPCAVIKMVGILQRSAFSLACNSRHADIRNQTRRLLLMAGAEKCFCRLKCLGRESSRSQQFLQCAAYRIIIVDDRYEFGFLMAAHKTNYAPKVNAAQSYVGMSVGWLCASFRRLGWNGQRE